MRVDFPDPSGPSKVMKSPFIKSRFLLNKHFLHEGHEEHGVMTEIHQL